MEPVHAGSAAKTAKRKRQSLEEKMDLAKKAKIQSIISEIPFEYNSMIGVSIKIRFIISIISSFISFTNRMGFMIGDMRKLMLDFNDIENRFVRMARFLEFNEPFEDPTSGMKKIIDKFDDWKIEQDPKSNFGMLKSNILMTKTCVQDFIIYYSGILQAMRSPSDNHILILEYFNLSFKYFNRLHYKLTRSQ